MPFVPTPHIVVERMLAIAKVKPGEMVYDLGAGDGRIISSAVHKFGAKALGIELNSARCYEILERLSKERIRDSANVIRGDFLEINLAMADVVTLYLLTSVNSSIRPKLERELKLGSRVVSHDFPIRGWTPTRTEMVKDVHNTRHQIYLYQVPRSITTENVKQKWRHYLRRRSM